MSRRVLLAFILAPFSGCTAPASGILQIVTGGENDTFSRAPAPVKLEVDSVNSSGAVHTLATAPLPASTVDLGSVDDSAVGTLRVTGSDASGNRLVYGQSVPIQFGALQGVTVPVFVQRSGEFARMPKPLSDARATPTIAVLGGRYLFVGGGGDPALSRATQLYDFAYLAPLGAPPSLPRAPKSVAFVGTIAWVIDENGATSFDFSEGVQADVVAPAGGSFGDIAGGATVTASDGTQYIVGATRATGDPTKSVLTIDPAGNASWATLSESRLGAAASWVDGRGLVVVGGSDHAAGVEILGAGTRAGVPLSYPPDASTGSGAATLDGQHVLLAGGETPMGQDAGAREIDLACNMGCATTSWAALPAGLRLAPAQVFASDPASALLVGDDPSGTTQVYRLTATTAVSIATKVAHAGARAVVSPVGSVVLFGGASEIESFVP